MYSSTRTLITLIILVSVVSGITGMVEAEKDYVGVTLNFLNCSGPSDDLLQKQIEAFEKETGATVILENVPYGQMFGKLVLGLRSGSYDVFAADYQWIPQFAKSDSLLPLDQYLNDPAIASPELDLGDFSKVVLDSLTINGVTYGLPWYANVNLGVVRKSLLRDSGLSWPDDWDGFLTVAKKMTRDTDGDGKVDIYGATVAGGRHSHLATEFRQYIWSFGSDFLDADYKPLFNNDKAVAALQYMIDLIHKYKVASPASVNYNYEDGLLAFVQGNVASTWAWPTTVATVSDPTKSSVSDDFQVVARPGVPLLSPWGFAVAKKSKYPEAAYKLVEWLASKESLREWAQRGYPVGRMSVLSDPVLLKDDPIMSVYKKSISRARYMPPLPHWEELRSNLIRHLSNAIIGKISAEEAIKRSAEAAEELADKY